MSHVQSSYLELGKRTFVVTWKALDLLDLESFSGKLKRTKENNQRWHVQGTFEVPKSTENEAQLWTKKTFSTTQFGQIICLIHPEGL